MTCQGRYATHRWSTATIRSRVFRQTTPCLDSHVCLDCGISELYLTHKPDLMAAVHRLRAMKAAVNGGNEVYCCVCVDPATGDERLEIFSTPARRQSFMDRDERSHVAYDYTLDDPGQMDRIGPKAS